MKSENCKINLLKEWNTISRNFWFSLEKLSIEHGSSFFVEATLFGLTIFKSHFIKNPAYIKHILFDNYLNYDKPDITFKVFQNFLGEDGLFTTNNNEIWRRDRAIWNPPFKFENIKKYVTAMVKQIDASLDSWQDYEKNNIPLNLDKATMQMTYNILLDTLLKGGDVDFSQIEQIVPKLFYCASNSAKYFGIIRKPTAMYQLRKCSKALMKVGDKLVVNSIKNNFEENIINLLYKNYKNFKDMNAKKIHKSLRAESLTILVAGHESTAGSIAHACAYLSLYPTYVKKIREEIAAVLGTRNPTYEDVESLVFTQAVIKESMRLRPPFLSIVRIAKEDDSIGQYKIKKGEKVIISIPSIHRLSPYWPNPEGFEPERFLKPLGDEYKYLFLPFNVGPHSCIGQYFAFMEAVLVIAMIYRRYDLFLTTDSTVDIEIKSFMNKLNTDVKMTVHSVKPDKA